MKRCPKCGAVYRDQKQYCYECEERLRAPLSPEEEKNINRCIEKKIDKANNRLDPLYVSVFDKIVGRVSLACAAALIVLIIVAIIRHQITFFPFLGILFFALSAVEALVPNISWSLVQLKLSYYVNNADEAQPTGFYQFSRKATIVVGAVCGVFLLLLSVGAIIRPPVLYYVDKIAAHEKPMFGSDINDYIKMEPDAWDKIIDNGDYTVSVFVKELNTHDTTLLREKLMIKALVEITGIGSGYDNLTKGSWLQLYYEDEYDLPLSAFHH